MQELEAVLLRMDRINTRLHDALSRFDPHNTTLLVSLRQDFTAECGNFIKELAADPQLSANPRLLERLQNMLDVMRAGLAHHQTRWQLSAIGHDPAGYLVARNIVHGRISQFIAASRELLGCDAAIADADAGADEIAA
jgi:hypothetical protein